MSTFWATFVKIWVTFYSNMWSHWTHNHYDLNPNEIPFRFVAQERILTVAVTGSDAFCCSSLLSGRTNTDAIPPILTQFVRKRQHRLQNRKTHVRARNKNEIQNLLLSILYLGLTDNVQAAVDARIRSGTCVLANFPQQLNLDKAEHKRNAFETTSFSFSFTHGQVLKRILNPQQQQHHSNNSITAATAQQQ